MNVLKGDDFEVGMFFTVLNDHKEARDVKDNITMEVKTITVTRFTKGGVFRIKAIDLPFISYERYNELTDKFYPETLDTREVDLKTLSKEYVKTVIGSTD